MMPAPAAREPDVENPQVVAAAAGAASGDRRRSSMRGRLQMARQQSTNKSDLASQAPFVLGAGCIICLLLPFVFLSVADIVIGALYLEDCPKERYIPIYLLVKGVLGIFSSYIDTKREGGKDACIGFIQLFNFGWFIAGNVWIFRTYNDFNSEDPDAADFCDPFLYGFAFWTLIASYILLPLIVCVMCCVVALVGDPDTDTTVAEQLAETEQGTVTITQKQTVTRSGSGHVETREMTYTVIDRRPVDE